MSGQHPLRQSRGGGESRPQPPRVEPVRASSTATTAVPSIETPSSDRAPKSSGTPIQSPTFAPTYPNAFRVPESPYSAGNESQKAAKIAIPRLKRSVDAMGDGTTRSGGRHRVNHACEPCRHRKTKCSGERPVCRHCQDFKIACYYADGKRDRVKKQFGTMTEKVADYEKLLRDLATRVSDHDAQSIRCILEKDTYDDDAAETMTIPSIEETAEEDEPGGESDASAGAGSTGALDRTEEDFTREKARETGFMGKNSEITWLQRLDQENQSGDTAAQDQHRQGQSTTDKSSSASRRKPRDKSIPLPEATEGLAVADMSYHLDDLTITTYDAVDPYEYPPPETCQRLFNAYMTRVHPTFPIVGKTNLVAQFQKFVTGQSQRPPEKWLAIMNLIFAIAAKYSHLVQAEWQGDERDHLLYFARARLLGTNAETLFQHPDLQGIQILGLISFYFLCTSQINRSWTLAGLAIRLATALGMNMRNDSTALKNSLKEIRYRVWWALYTLEHRLCSMTGRVNCILDDHCTTPLPAPIEEHQFDTDEGDAFLSKERQQGDRAPFYNSHSPSAASQSSSTARSRSQTKPTGSRSPSALISGGNMEWAKDSSPTSALYFLHLVQLTRLTQNIFHQLYSPVAIDSTWAEVQATMARLDEQLENWYRHLPSIFDFRRNQRDRDFYEYRLSLGFFYYGTKIMVHRPCLCRIDRKIAHQSAKSLNFNRQAATACVDAARDMLRLIPDEPNAVGLMSVGPWWSILHWIVQAATILLLEISFRAHHMPEEADAILEASKKGVRWLHALGGDNTSARRAWELCNSMLHQAVSKIGRAVKDLPTQAPGRPSVPNSSTATSMARKTTGKSQHYPQSSSTAQTPGSMYNPAATMSRGYGYANVDQLMHYDQYFPFDPSMNSSMPDGMPGGMANSMANGMPDGMADGMADGMPDGMADGMPDGMAVGMADGMANGMTDGMAGGMTDGMSDGMADGMSDGISDGMHYGQPSSAEMEFMTNAYHEDQDHHHGGPYPGRGSSRSKQDAHNISKGRIGGNTAGDMMQLGQRTQFNRAS